MLLSILSGIFIGTSYIPFIPWALFFCFVPLWFTWLFHNLPAWKVFFYGWLTQFTLALIGFHWIAHTAIEFGRLPFIVGYLILFLFCATQNLHIPLAGLLWHYTHKRFHFHFQSSLLFLAVATALFEKLSPMIFHWNLGYPWFWSHWPAYQWADTIGFEGLSFLTILINAYILWIFITIKKTGPRSNIKHPTLISNVMAFLKNQKVACGHIMALLIFFIILNITGKMKQNTWSDTNKVFHIGAVQANIGNFDKYMAYHNTFYYPAIYEQYFDLTQSLLNNLSVENLDLIIWPETAFPGQLDHHIDSSHKYRLQHFISQHKTPLLTGSYSSNPQDNKYYNALFFFNPEGLLLERYRKSTLLAFGEYFPGVHWFPFLKNWIPQISHFAAGQKGPSTWTWKDINFGLQICYEGLDSNFSINLAKQNAHLIINVTNDSWFGHTFEPYQHLYMTLARAIEVRRPVIRVTNTGITSAVLANGDLLKQGPQKEKWTQHFAIPYSSKNHITFFARFGKYISWLQILLLILIIMIRVYKEQLVATQHFKSKCLINTKR